MFYKYIISILLLMFLNISQAEPENISFEESKIISTIAGNLEIKRGNEGVDNQIILNGKVIKKIDFPYVNLEHKYSLKESDVLLMSANSGGSASFTGYFVIELPKNNQYIITDEVYSQDHTFKYLLDNGRLTIDLGFDFGLKKYAIYENKILHIKKSKLNTTKVIKYSCKYLYNDIYKKFVSIRRCSDEPSQVTGNASFIPVHEMKNNPSLNINQLINISKRDCKNGKIIKYSKFKNIICK